MKFRIRKGDSADECWWYVEHKGLFSWKSSSVYLNFFLIHYESKEDAEDAIRQYQEDRFTEIN